MPKKLEKALENSAEKKGLLDERKDAYIYGGMRRAGWVPGREKKSKGK